MVVQREILESLQPLSGVPNIKREVLELVPEATARKFNVIPLEVNGKVLRLAMTNPSDITVADTLSALTNLCVEPVAVSAEKIQEVLDFYYKSSEEDSSEDSYQEIERQLSRIKSPSIIDGEQTIVIGEDDSPIIRAFSLILEDAVRAGASDIHLQTQKHELLVRYRIDGVLHDVLSLPLHTARLLISRIKILANLNIADHHHPQDGQLAIERNGPNGHKKRIDIRVATMPSAHGETAALRLLDNSKVVIDLTELGFRAESLAQYREMLRAPYGMILVSGPTGAGKTTTLYASLNSLDYWQRNIITIEDPIEYEFYHITQMQVNVQAGLTFAKGLRSTLRADPDVILIGEIRDAETAQIAMQAALTGHLVLSSIHANDAVSVVSRLLDLGIEPFLISSALVGVVSQRMVRKICPNCARNVKVSLVEQMAYAADCAEERSEFLYGAGCELCNSGYRKRTALFETMRISDKIRTIIVNRGSMPELKAQALKEGMIPLRKDGMLKVKENITTPSEVLQNAYSI
ncbi:MAG: type II/IV secretion system protein [Chloroflexi bacterium]|nr:type II/IV secretion system protein [Chloroflexota bacterium]MBI3931478.1 type II/IV secretion system protein [Chloroflexota bacterium]